MLYEYFISQLPPRKGNIYIAHMFIISAKKFKKELSIKMSYYKTIISEEI